MTFFVPGEPQGKARPRFSNGHVYTPKKTREYEEAIRNAYISKLSEESGAKFEKGTPISVRIAAFYSIPKSVSKETARKMIQCEIMPTKKPDVDNVAKVVLDALNGLAWYDDAQIVYLYMQKHYSYSPAVMVSIYEVD